MPNIEVVAAESVVVPEPEAPTEKVFLSPLDVNFSQNVIYPKFSDGKSVDDTVRQIRALGEEQAELVLEAPFPTMEAVRWQPKLRDGQGRPLLDGEGGHRRGQEGIFSVDNRRLYALQRAAVARYPRRCVVEVVVVTDRSEVMKHLKKFRTRTNGLSITVSEWNGVGRDNARAFSAMRVWDWRSAVARQEAEGGGGEAAAAAAEAGSCGCWEYLDRQDIQRGPFSNWQMRQWWERKMLPTDLRIRPYDAAKTVEERGAREGAADEQVLLHFLTVSEVFDAAPSPFAPGFSPRATHKQAELTRCAQCNRKRWEGWAGGGEQWYCATCWRKWKRDAA